MSNKYNAKKQSYKGLKFDSKKELHRYMILEKMLKCNLMVNGTKIGRYTADFRYLNKQGETVVEDVKAKITKTRDYILRKKILATYNPPVIIKEII